jgi:hypothetical protein
VLVLRTAAAFEAEGRQLDLGQVGGSLRHHDVITTSSLRHHYVITTSLHCPRALLPLVPCTPPPPSSGGQSRRPVPAPDSSGTH